MDLGMEHCEPFPMGKKPKKARRGDIPSKAVKTLRDGTREAAAEKERRTFRVLPWKAWFKACGVTAREIADVIDETEQHLSNIQAGRREYLRSQIEDMAAYLSSKTGKRIEPWMLLLPPDDPKLAILATVESMRAR